MGDPGCRPSLLIATEACPGPLRLGRHEPRHLGEQRAHVDRRQIELLGSHELEEALDDPIEPLDLVGDHVQVLARRRVRAAEARLQELEVDAHRVQGVLDLVRHAGGEPPERRELLRIGHQRLDRPHRIQISNCQHGAAGPVAAGDSIARHRQLAAVEER